MSDHSAEKIEAAIRMAVHEAIKTVGIPNFKRCSFFLSNERAAVRATKAA